jgi:hypothetical protein
MKFGQSRSFSLTFDRYRGVLPAFLDFSIILSTNELPVRISFPNAREEDSGRKIWAALFARQHALLWRVAAIVPVAR